MSKALVVMIDNDPDDIEILEDAISDSGWEVDFLSFSSGVDLLRALDTYPNFQPNLILLDYNMPILTGAQTLKKLRESDYKGGPILILTTGATALMNQEVLELGAQGCLIKPTTYTMNLELARSLRRFIEAGDLAELILY